MIILKLNEGKRLKFSYAVASVHPENIHGHFIVDFGDSFIGYPIKIYEGKIVVEIKNLSRYIKEDNVGVVDARLEVIAIDTFITPWRGQVKIENIKENIENIKENININEEEVKEEVNSDFSNFLDASLDEFKKKKEEPKKEENHLSGFLDAPLDEFKKKEEPKENHLSGFLDAPIEEIIEGE